MIRYINLLLITIVFLFGQSVSVAQTNNSNILSYGTTSVDNFPVNYYMNKLQKPLGSTKPASNQTIKHFIVPKTGPITSPTGTGVRAGNVGNSGSVSSNDRSKFDESGEPDFGPYMRELQQRIKRNWEPPKGEESRRVVLLFSIAKDGRLLNVEVSKSSGLTSADNAAIAAVKMTAPFKPLPSEYKSNSIDIQFTFDYTVFGASRYGYPSSAAATSSSAATSSYLDYLKDVIVSTCNITEKDSFENCLYFDLEFDEEYNLLDIKSSVNKYDTSIQKLYLYKFKPCYNCREKNFRVLIKNINRQKHFAQKAIITLLKSYWLPSDSYSNCIVKVNLDFYNGGVGLGSYKIDSFDIVKSTENSEYNDTVKIALIRSKNILNKQNGYQCIDFFPIYGKMSIYLDFQGNIIKGCDNPISSNISDIVPNNNNVEKKINNDVNNKNLKYDINKSESGLNFVFPTPKTEEVSIPKTNSNQSQYELQNTTSDDQIRLPHMIEL